MDYLLNSIAPTQMGIVLYDIVNIFVRTEQQPGL